jgi:hypothetical protein
MTVPLPPTMTDAPSPAPTRADPANFRARADAYHAWLVPWVNVEYRATLTWIRDRTTEVLNRALEVESNTAASAGSANAAALSAQSAGNSANAAGQNAAAAQASLNTFRGQYYGPLASDPATDPLGAAMGAGDLYWNTTAGQMRVFSGGAWVQTFLPAAAYVDLLSAQTVGGVKTFSSNPVMSAGTANGVAYLNGSKVLTTGSALTFDGTNFATTGTVTSAGASNSGNLTFTGTGNRITGDFSNATAGNRVAFQTSTVNGATRTLAIPNGTGSVSAFALLNSSDANNASWMQVAVGLTEAQLNSTLSGTGTYLPMTFYTGGSERVRIDTSGNVGIGTSSPGAKFEVAAGRAKFVGNSDQYNIEVKYNAATSGGWIGSPAVDVLALYRGAGGTESMRITSAGNVGIGTSSPQAKLAVSNAGAAGLEFFTNYPGGGVGTYIQSFNRSAVAYANTAYDAAQHVFFTSGTERARIDSSGNLLVGKTTTTIGTSGFVAKADGMTATNANAEAANFNRESSDGGLVLFRRASSQVGSISVTTTTTSYVTSSDYRLKNITGPITNSGAYIDSLNPVEGTWKADGSVFVGLIAHEAQEASRTPVATGVKDGAEMQAMDYSNAELIANLIAELQSVRKRLAAAGI